MVELVVNLVLILAALVLLSASLMGTARRRRQDRRQHAEERRLILHAFLGAAAEPTEAVVQPPGQSAQVVRATAPQHLDPASVASLLDLLEDRRPAPRGLFAGLVSGPRGVWAAGARAGQHLGRRTMGQRGDGIENTDPQLYRAAAREILDVHAHDPRDAHVEYLRYADAVGDRALAELYVRSAAHTTYGEPDRARLVVEQITSADSSPQTDPAHVTPMHSA
jgi:hypothetical protein